MGGGNAPAGAGMSVDISWFSLASILALALFILVIIPRALGHILAVAGRLARGRPSEADPWLVGIALVVLVCAGLVAGLALWSDRAQRALNASAAVTFAFLFFAAPAVMQVMRAWAVQHAHKAKAGSHVLAALAVLSLPASMAIPTAALMRAAALPPAAAAPADNPAAAIADARFFTDNEVANDPEDYPAAAWLARNFTWHAALPARRGGRRRSFLAEAPAYTAFWFDETTNMLTFDAPDAFGVLVSRITHVRANWAFSLMVWGYKLLCALVLVAVTFDVFLLPLAETIRRTRRRRPAEPNAARALFQAGPETAE